MYTEKGARKKRARLAIDNGQSGKVIHSYRRSSNKDNREYYDGTQEDLQNYYNNTRAKDIIFK